MLRRIHKNQSGIAAIAIVLIVAVVIAGGAMVFARVQQSKDNKAAQDKQRAVDQQLADAKSQAELNQQASESEALEKKEETPAPTPARAPDATPTPQTQPKPAIIHPSQGNCKPNDGKFIVYGAVNGDAPTYYDSARTNRSATTIAYGAQVEVHCYENSIQKLVYEDFFVAPESLSVTKP